MLESYLDGSRLCPVPIGMALGSTEQSPTSSPCTSMPGFVAMDEIPLSLPAAELL